MTKEDIAKITIPRARKLHVHANKDGEHKNLDYEEDSFLK
jgi:hypothetical protein